MAITLSTKARNASVDARTALLNEGTGAGKLKIRDSGNVVLATFTLSDPAFGASSNGTGAAAALPKSTTAGATGTAANYIATDSDDEEMWSGNVTATGGGGSCEIDSTSITSGQTVNLTAWTHSQPA